MSKDGVATGGIFPGNLRGYKLKKVHHRFQRLIFWVIIIIVIVWLVNKQVLIDFYYLLIDYITNFS